ncbi:MAG: ABC transporter permease [Eubacteriales bacterium]|nr:ABC transporter permease [Eubacteriales bacterium]
MSSKSLSAKSITGFIKKNISLSAFLVLIIFFAVIQGTRFINFDNILTILNQTVVVAVVSFGLTFVIIEGGIDLSVGSVLGLSAVIGALVLRATGSSILAILAALVVGLVCGLFNGIVHTILRIPSFITTLGMLSIARALCIIVTDGSIIMIPFDSGIKQMALMPWILVCGVVVFALTYILLNYTVFGRYTRMIGGDERVAVMTGIKVKKYKIMIFTLCSMLTAFGGIIMAGRIGAGSPTTGEGFELDCISAVVLGGTPLTGGIGGIGGTVLGALILSILANGMVLSGIESEVQLLVKGFVLVAAVFISLEREKIGVIK